MPVSYRFDGPVVIVIPEGLYDSVEARSAWMRAELDPAYPANARICLDLRNSSSLARRPIGDMRDSADWFAERADRAGRCCALVVRAGVQYGLMRMASAWVEHRGIEVLVTRSVEDAVAWLKERSSTG